MICWPISNEITWRYCRDTDNTQEQSRESGKERKGAEEKRREENPLAGLIADRLAIST